MTIGVGDPGVVHSAFFAMECPIVEPAIYRALPEMAKVFRRLYSWTDGPSLLPQPARAAIRMTRTTRWLVTADLKTSETIQSKGVVA